MTRRIRLEDDEQMEADAMLSCGLDGECYAFAIAFQRLTGYEIVALSTPEHTYRHALVRDQQGRLYDARGLVTEEELGAPFGVSESYVLRVVTHEDLRRIRPIAESSIEWAERLIETHWPELVVTPSRFTQCLEGFLAELEQLTKRYQIYLRGPSEGMPARLFVTGGDPIVYRYRANAFGTGHVLVPELGHHQRMP